MEYTIELYNIDTITGVFTKIDVLTTFTNFVFFSKLNGLGALTFNLALQDPKATQANLYQHKTQVLVKRMGTPVWIGVIDKVTGNYSDVTGTISINCLSYFAHLYARYTSASYIQIEVDAGDIVTGLLTYTQALTNGELGIDEGYIETIGTISDTMNYANIGQKIVDYSDNIVGFDFELIPIVDANNNLSSVNLNIYKGLGRFRDDLPSLELGINVQDVSFASKGDIFNHVTALGSGTGSSILTTIVEDIYSEAGFTRREEILKFSDISVNTTLENKADLFLTDNKVQHYDINITLKPDSVLGYGIFSLGDVLKLNLVKDNSIINFHGTARVVELRVSIDDTGTEYITPKLQYVA